MQFEKAVIPKSVHIFWIPLSLFILTQLAAVVLFALVILSPWLDNKLGGSAAWRTALALFAHDGTLRRTALASAGALAITAYICFRPRGLVRWPPSRNARVRTRQTVAGA
jgi:hypothetical protein